MSAREVWLRALGAALLHLVLLLLWPLVEPAYAPAFRGLAQLTLGVVAPLPGAVEVRLEPGSGGPLAEDIVRMDTIVALQPREFQGQAATFGGSSYFHGYFPLSVLLALFAASVPRPWRALRRPFLWALVLLHAGLVVRFVPALYYCYSKCTLDGRAPLGLGPDGTRALGMAKHFAWDDVLPNYLLPLVVYALCVFGPRSGAEPRD